jgi:hypothetical protein
MASGRTAKVFLGLAMLLVAVDWVSRSLLHLDCLGPYLYGWGCLFSPYPPGMAGIADNTSLVLGYVIGAVVLWVVASVAGEVGFRLLGRYLAWKHPQWVQEQLEQDQPRGVRIR